MLGERMNRFLICILPATVLTLTTTASAQTPVTQNKWSPRIGVEGKPGTDRSLGEADLFFPVWQNNDTLLFANLRGRFDNQDSLEGNAGLGLRHMLDTGWNLGGYGYFDRRRTPGDNRFNQATFGVEALSLNWDVRANGYIPVGTTEHEADSASVTQFTGTGFTYRAGEERSMSGFDAEIGWRLPLFKRDAAHQLRLYAGGYRFTDSKAETIEGPRTRLDMNFNDIPFLGQGARLSLGLEHQHDDPRGSQTFGLVRLSIPLGGPERGSRQPTPMERRMTDPVIRDVDVVSQAGAYGRTEHITETAEGKRITVLDSTSISNGTDLATAINAAGANTAVILNGDYTDINQLAVLQDGQDILGKSTLLAKTPSGKIVNLTTPSASITGEGENGSGGPNRFFEMANNSSLVGVQASISRSGSVVIAQMDNVSNVQIHDNVLHSQVSASTAALFLIKNSHHISIRNNNATVVANGSTGQALAFTDNNSYIDFSDNTLFLSGTILTTDIHTYLLAGGVTITNLSGTGNTANIARCYIVSTYTITGAIETNGTDMCP